MTSTVTRSHNTKEKEINSSYTPHNTYTSTIGDGHESDLIAETLALNGAEEFACNTCSNYEYLTYEEACSYAFLHSNRLEQAMSASERKQHGPEPKDWRDIKGRADSDKWLQAAHEEVMGLLENGTFTPVQLPPGRRAIGCRWVFKLKRKPDGSVDRYKACLVAKGFSQRPGLDFGQVFAPTARWAALRAIFALAAIEDLELYSLDISNVFLNGEIDHEVFMQTPEGFKDHFGSGFVLKLQRALYGLKQAGHQWHKKLDETMQLMKFKLVLCDSSYLFLSKNLFSPFKYLSFVHCYIARLNKYILFTLDLRAMCRYL